MPSKIELIEFYLPENVVTNEDLTKIRANWQPEKIEEKIGVRQRHVCAKNETGLDLAEKACEKLFENNEYDKSKIDFLILCTQSPDYFLPTTACLLQSRLKLRVNIGAFDYNLGCSGYIYGLGIASGLIEASIAENILLVTSETYSKHLHNNDIALRSIFGDAASATIVSKCDWNGIKKIVFGTDGRMDYANNLIVKNGGMRNPYNENAETYTDESGNQYTDNNLYMNGPGIFNFTIQTVPSLIYTTLEKNNLKLEDVDHFVFHQANKYMLNYLRKKLKISEEKFYIDLYDTGNTVSSSIPIALKNCISKKIVQKGAKVLICGFGVGYSWGATIVEI
ncbi:MAG: ketoacyl-ACP synthase III [Bacteroidales bacterium]|nr:ketoacyl-ACP synthase III [Bacteroidales bacterium]